MVIATEYVNDLLGHIKTSYKQESKPVSRGSLSGRPLYKITPKIAEQVFIKHHPEYIDITTLDEIIDCYSNGYGIGIKTFVLPQADALNKSEKIGEFGKFISSYKLLRGLELVIKVSELYNERLAFATEKYDLFYNQYHCLIVDQNASKLIVAEYDLKPIGIKHLKLLKKTEKSIFFTDGVNDFSFYHAKNVIKRNFPINRANSCVYSIDDFKNECFCPHCGKDINLESPLDTSSTI